MNKNVVGRLQCPACTAANLACAKFDAKNEYPDEIINGVVWCQTCLNWFPIDDSLLDFLCGDLAYREDRQRFWGRYSGQLADLGLSQDKEYSKSTLSELQAKQQAHFDWWADNGRQSYLTFSQMPFWKAFDYETFKIWRQEIQTGGWLLDVGCAQGRSTFQLADLPVNIIAFDISKRLVRQAITRYEQGNYQAQITFLVADAIRFPVISETFNYVLIYGVLHHLPNPGLACQEVARILKPGGLYFGVENNVSVFRGIFDLWQKIVPIWHEEAGPEALMGDNSFQKWFLKNKIDISTLSSVYVPPQLVNLLGDRVGHWLLNVSNRLVGSAVFFRNNGGIIIVRGQKRQAGPEQQLVTDKETAF